MNQPKELGSRICTLGPLEHLTDIDAIISGKLLPHEFLDIVLVLQILDLVDLDNRIAARNEEKFYVRLGETLEIIEVEQFKEKCNLIAVLDIPGEDDQPREEFQAIDEEIVVSIEVFEDILMPSEEFDKFLIVDRVRLGNGLEQSIEFLDFGERIAGEELINRCFLHPFKSLEEDAHLCIININQSICYIIFSL
jgi:hypothetical protein